MLHYNLKGIKMKKRTWLLVFSFLLVLGVQRAQADVATEGEVAVKVELVNPTNFPGFNFFVKYQTYHYDMGWQPGPVNKVYLTAGQHVETGARFSKSYLYAEDKQGNEFVSKEEIGGSVIDKGKSLAYYLQQVKVLAVKGGEVQFEVKSVLKVDDDGKTKEVKADKLEKGGMEMNWWVVAVPVVCLLGLVAFLMLRGKGNSAA
jgi:hypothetical protein